MRASLRALLTALLPLTPLQPRADVVSDLDAIKGIRHYDGPPAGKALLRANGFVVTPRYYHRIFSPYFGSPLPAFITADSVHRTFHVILEDQLKKVEEGFVDDVATLTDELIGDVGNMQPCDAATNAIAFLHVASFLLGLEGAAEGVVADELALIRAAGGIAPSPLFGYRIDYTQFKPRGFYTESRELRRYFKAMTWYGNAAFRLKSDRELAMAAHLVRALRSNEEALAIWKKLDRTYSYLIAPTDDLTPLEFHAAIEGIDHAPGTKTFGDRCREEAKTLRDPRINSMVLGPGEMGNWVQLTKGMRLFGKRYIPDSEIFMNLTHPNVASRGFPSGLDMMAANGAARARALQEKQPDTQSDSYRDGLRKSTDMLETLKSDQTPSHYVQFLKIAETLTANPHARASPFCKTAAYADKSLMTAISSWASMRHTWALHAKQSVICLGCTASTPMPGYVEPNPAFLSAITRLNRLTIDVLGDLGGVEVERFSAFGKLLESLTEMLRKQFAGEEFTKKELSIFDRYANIVGDLQGFDFNTEADSSFPWMSLIADVHTELLTQKCLEVGTGGAMPIYAIVEKGGAHHLLKGAVYSYFEFKQPIADRLTDEQWRSQWSTGQVPKMPAWTRSFVATPNVSNLLERMSRGEVVDELLHIDDPELDRYLAAALEVPGFIAQHGNCPWILSLAAKKLGDKAVGPLLELTSAADERQCDFVPIRLRSPFTEDQVADFAGSALAHAVDVEHVPILLGIALGPHEARAKVVATAGFSASKRVREVFTCRYLEQVTQEREGILRKVRAKALPAHPLSVDVTGELLRMYKTSAETCRKSWILSALAAGWAKRDADLSFFGVRPVPAPTAPESDLARWREALRLIVMAALRGDDEELRGSATSLAGSLGLEEAVPIIVSRIDTKPTVPPVGESSDFIAIGSADLSELIQPSTTGVHALGQIGSDEAVDALLRLAYMASQHVCREAIDALKAAKSRRAIPRLRELLDDTASSGWADARICDLAADALARIVQDGPKVTPLTDSPERRDRVVAEWKAICDKMEPPPRRP